MRNSEGGTLNWCFTVENEFGGTTIEVEGTCRFNYTPGSPGMMYERHGVAPYPPEPPEVEYYDFLAKKVTVSLWFGTDKTVDITAEWKTLEEQKKAGEWYDKIVGDSDKERESLDEKVNEILSSREEPCDRDDDD